ANRFRRRRVATHRALRRNEADRGTHHQAKPEIQIQQLIDVIAETSGVERQIAAKHHAGGLAHPVVVCPAEGHLHHQLASVERIGLLGAGGQAREIASYLPHSTELFWAVSSGFRDSSSPHQIDVSSPTKRDRDSWVVAAVGPPAVRRDLVAVWPGNRFATIISSAAYVEQSCRIGAVIAPGGVLTVNVTVGEHCLVNVGAT
ncbi:MAG: hypothetical protein JWR78_1494, partial [Mycobacterium sp.]|nr:hypothetical protein [Mycobacterium sp.]